MSDKEYYRSLLRQSTGIRLAVLFAAFFLFLIIAAVFSAAFSEIPGLSARGRVLLSSVCQCLIAFCIPAWIVAKFSGATPWRFLGVATIAPPRAFAGVVLVYIAALPAMNQLIAWNAGLHFPEWASGIEATLREWEETNGAVAATALMSDGFWEMLAGVAIIGILTGFSEEVFFRGGLQNIFSASGVNRNVAVWGAAFIFSAVHFQFFGFFPRLLMGAFFGYLLVWTGSLWPAVFAHALNNSIVVVTAWLYDNPDGGGLENFGVSGNGAFPWAAVMSFLATALIFVLLKRPLFKTASLKSQYHG